MVHKLESIGCSYLTVHARTKHERHEPIHIDQLKLVAECSKQMPIVTSTKLFICLLKAILIYHLKKVANGDLFTLEDCKSICKQAKIRGVMCARGLLQNPALFADYNTTPIECIKDWIDLSLKSGTSFTYFHSTLTQMLQNVLSKPERRFFNSLYTTSAVIDYLNENVFFEPLV